MLQQKCSDLGYLNLKLTISNFTPKPHTPFQWHNVSTNEFRRKQGLLKKAFKALKGIKVNYTDVRISAIENFIGRGNRSISQVIEKAWKSGAGMDAWFESQDVAYEAWTKAISHAGLEDKYRKLEINNWENLENLSKNDLNKLLDQPLPWDHIDAGIDKNWLIQDLQRAIKSQVIPDCSFASCSSCGVCGTEFGHNKVMPSPPIPVQKSYQTVRNQKVCRVRFQFSKTNPMHLISHLDLMRLFERALRRSMLPISYSGGFHPLPRIKIGLALPLGVEAFGEWMDLDFYKEVDSLDIQQKLQDKLPEGIKLITSKLVPLSGCNLSQKIRLAIWSFDVIAQPKNESREFHWEKGIASILKAKKLVWKDKDKKGRAREIDFKEALISLKIKKSYIGSISLSSIKKIRLELKTVIDPIGRSIKPIQIKSWLDEYFDLNLTIKNIKRDELQLQ